MPRTIEDRLNEILEALDNTEPPPGRVITNRLLYALIADLKAEGIAGHMIRGHGEKGAAK